MYPWWLYSSNPPYSVNPTVHPLEGRDRVGSEIQIYRHTSYRHIPHTTIYTSRTSIHYPRNLYHGVETTIKRIVLFTTPSPNMCSPPSLLEHKHTLGTRLYTACHIYVPIFGSSVYIQRIIFLPMGLVVYCCDNLIDNPNYIMLTSRGLVRDPWI